MGFFRNLFSRPLLSSIPPPDASTARWVRWLNSLSDEDILELERGPNFPLRAGAPEFQYRRRVNAARKKACYKNLQDWIDHAKDDEFLSLPQDQLDEFYQAAAFPPPNQKELWRELARKRAMAIHHRELQWLDIEIDDALSGIKLANAEATARCKQFEQQLSCYIDPQLAMLQSRTAKHNAAIAVAEQSDLPRELIDAEVQQLQREIQLVQHQHHSSAEETEDSRKTYADGIGPIIKNAIDALATYRKRLDEEILGNIKHTFNTYERRGLTSHLHEVLYPLDGQEADECFDYVHAFPTADNRRSQYRKDVMQIVHTAVEELKKLHDRMLKSCSLRNQDSPT